MNQSITKRRSFLSGRKNQGQRVTIGFAGIADFRSFMGQEYLAGIMKACADYDLNFINMAGAIKYSLFDDIDFIPHYLKTFRFMKAPLIDGLVTWASSMCSLMDDNRVLGTFNSLKPLPMVDIGYLEIPGVPCIRIDNTMSISMIMEHLVVSHNYKKFAFFGSSISAPHKSRRDNFKEELKKLNIDEIPNSVFMSKSLDPIDIAICVDQLCSAHDLHNHNSFDVIVCSSDIIAANLIEELDKRGISVPMDVAVTGFNNQYNGVTARSPVTTVDLEYFKRGYAAVELLIDRIINPNTPVETRLVSTSLILRQSCGCFENAIVSAGNPYIKDRNRMTDTNVDANGSEEELRTYLTNEIYRVFPQQSGEEIREFIDAIFMDIYDKLDPSQILRWFQRLLQNSRKQNPISNSQFQETISSLRRIILPMVKENEEQFLYIENIFNQMRTLVSVFIEYDTFAAKESTYLLNNISQIAMSFASATNGKQIQDVLRYQLHEMEIPGIILSLSENMMKDLGPTSIELVLPEPPADIKEKLPSKVFDPACISKTFFPHGRRYSLMLEILHHAESYFGFALLEIGNPNIAIYDTVRMLLSNALYSVYTTEGRTRERSSLITEDQLVGILNIPSDKPERPNTGLTVKQITSYLMDHLDEMTNLDQMASDLMVSKSHLVRRAKELTGYTIQNLHERLKIEQAKSLLQVENIKLTEIAQRLGFQNQNYFSSVFKKNTGMSPRAWSKRN